MSQELAKGVEHLTAARYHILASVVMLYFDWMLTFSLEVERFWKSKLTGPTILFFANRYFPIIGVILEMVAYFTDLIPPEICAKHVVPLIVMMVLVNQSVVGMVLLLRTYALYHRNNTILLLISVAWATATAVGIWGGSCLVPQVLPPGTTQACIAHAPDNLQYRFSAAYFGLLGYDALIYALTLRKTLGICQAKSFFTVSNNALVGLVMRDGSIYYMVLLVATLLSVMMICFAPSDLRNINATFNALISVTITSRLLLNLRQGVNRGNYRCKSGMSTDAAWSLTARLSEDLMDTVIGNIGEDLEDEASASLGRRSMEIRHSWSIESLETGSEGSLEEDDVLVVESIEASELRMGRPRAIYWGHLGPGW